MNHDPFGLRSLDIEKLRAKRGVKWSAFDVDYAAWVADMDFPVAPEIHDAVGAIVDGDEFGYPGWLVARKTPAARLLVERMQQRFEWSIDLDSVYDLDDVIQGVRVAVQHLSDPGDALVLHTPAYHPFLDTGASMGRPIHEIPARRSGSGYEFDYAALDAELSDPASRAKVWILCHPQNPLGHIFDRAELETIAEIALRHDLVVISDEVHADIRYVGGRHIPLAAIGDEIAARTVTVTSASKAFNLAGLRWAAMHVGYESLRERIEALPAHYLGAPNTMAIAATVAAWTHGQPWLDAVVEVLDENRHALGDLLEQHLPGAVYHPPQATYLAWVDVSNAGLGDDPHATIRSRGVEFSPGPQFGTGGAGHVRINLATSPSILAAMVQAAGSG